MDGAIPSHTSIGKFYNEFIVPNRDSLFSKITDAIRDECNIDFNTAFLDGSSLKLMQISISLFGSQQNTIKS